jgi:hypothetical protein
MIKIVLKLKSITFLKNFKEIVKDCLSITCLTLLVFPIEISINLLNPSHPSPFIRTSQPNILAPEASGSGLCELFKPHLE